MWPFTSKILPSNRRVMIDWNHPLSKGLAIDVHFDATGQSVVELVRHSKGVLNGGAVVRMNGQLVMAALPSASTSFVEFSGIPDYNLLGPITLYWKGIISSAGDYRHFAGKHTGGGGTFNPFDFRTNNASPVAPVCVRADNVSSQTDGSSASITTGDLTSITYVDPRLNTSRNRKFYKNGIQTDDLGAAAGTACQPGNTTLRLGRRADGVVNMDGYTQYFRAYSIALQSEQVLWMEKEPHAHLVTEVPRVYFLGITSVVIVPLTQEVSDAVFGYNDAVSVTAPVWAAPLTVSVSDSWGGPKDKFKAKDSIDLFQVGENFEAQFGDSIEIFLDDDLVVGTGLAVSDSNASNYADAIEVTPGIAFECFDSNQDKWLDAVETLVGCRISTGDDINLFSDAVTASNAITQLQQTASDNINNFSDAAAVNIKHLYAFEDNITFADAVQTKLTQSNAYSDSISFSDAIQVKLGIFLNIEDTIENLLIDVVVVNSPQLIVAVSDSLPSYTDAVSTRLSRNDLEYLRRYLNDVV